MARLKTYYFDKVQPDLMQELSYGNLLQVPRLDKIVVNIGCGEAVQDSKKIGQVVEELALIAGQRPVVTRAKKSVASFKLREGMPIGAKVTLRKNRMYEFFDRLVTIALPRIRDFRGLSLKSFDGRGNYALGLREQIVFPEIDYDKVDQIRGMNVVICTTAQTDREAKLLLDKFDFPFVRSN